MSVRQLSYGVVLACLASLCAEVQATPLLGGSVSTAADTGRCRDDKQIPQTTQQDTFTLSGATACGGQSASVDLKGDAASASVGLKASASGDGNGSASAAAMVSLYDSWLIGVPLGTLPGLISIPVSLTLEGIISPGALNNLGSFLDYTMIINDHYLPQNRLEASGKVTTTGSFAQTVSGDVAFRYFDSAALPMTADISILLTMPQLIEGVLDFFNTASISMTLADGFSAFTSSGLPLQFDVAQSETAEPGVGVLLVAGLGLVRVLEGRRRRVVPGASRLQPTVAA